MKYYYCSKNQYIYRTKDGIHYELYNSDWLRSAYQKGKNNHLFDFRLLDLIEICRKMKEHKFKCYDLRQVIIDYIEGDLI